MWWNYIDKPRHPQQNNLIAILLMVCNHKLVNHCVNVFFINVMVQTISNPRPKSSKVINKNKFYFIKFVEIVQFVCICLSKFYINKASNCHCVWMPNVNGYPITSFLYNNKILYFSKAHIWTIEAFFI